MIKFKKYLILFFSIFTLIFIFNNNKINAYYNETKTIFSNSLKIDKNDYYDINIFDFKDSNYNQTKFYHLSLNTSNNQLKFTCEGNYCYGNVYITNILEINKNYTFIFESYTTDTTKNNRIGLTNVSNNVDNIIYGQRYVSGNTKYSINFTAQSNNLYLIAYLTSGTFNNEFYTTLSNIMIVEGNNVPDNYSEKFQFGYKINNNYTANTFSYTLVDNYDNTKTYTLNNNSSVYVPFQYIENNAVTFSYSVKYNTTTDIYSGAVNIKFIPVFSGTLKENNNNQLKSKYFYTYNYIYYQNFKLSNLIDIYLSDLLNIEFISSSYDNNTLIINNDNLTKANNVISNYTSDVKQQTTFQKDIYFNGIDSIYTFNLKTNLLRAQNDQLIYNINFDYIGVGVLNSMATNSYIDNNGNDLEVYNTCGNIFEDFKCNLSNATTFVIFNIPLLGPVFNFAKSLVVGVDSLVQLINSFNGFGIMFGVFIIFMSYCIIRKIYNK